MQRSLASSAASQRLAFPAGSSPLIRPSRTAGSRRQSLITGTTTHRNLIGTTTTHRSRKNLIRVVPRAAAASAPRSEGARLNMEDLVQLSIESFGEGTTPSGKNIVIAGGGNAAHVAAGMFAHMGANVNMFLSFPEEAENIRKGVLENGGITVELEGESYRGSPNVVSSEAIEVIPGADLIIIITPAFAHEPILHEIKPFVTGNTIVGAMPSPGGFNWMAEHILGDDVTIFGGDSLPWACRVEEVGKRVSLLGTKSHVEVSVHPHGAADTGLFDILNEIFTGTTFTDGGHFLNCTLFPTNCIIHPGIMYGLWKDWDGVPVKEAPLFYQGLTDETADVLTGLSDDIQNTKKALETKLGLDLSLTLPIYDYQMSVYGQNIDDSSNLRTVFATNHAFRGLLCPMDKQEDGTLTPAFGCRYLTEDLPHGLAVLKGVAEIAGVETPHFDKVLTWAQEKINRVYIEDGKIKADSPDVMKSGCPQRWGLKDIEDLRVD